MVAMEMFWTKVKSVWKKDYAKWMKVKLAEEKLST